MFCSRTCVLIELAAPLSIHSFLYIRIFFQAQAEYSHFFCRCQAKNILLNILIIAYDISVLECIRRYPSIFMFGVQICH